MFHLQLQQPDKKRWTHFAVQLLTGSFLILAARAIYFQHSYYQTFLGYDAKNLLSIVLWVVLVLFVIDALRNFLFTRDLGVTKMTLIFGFFLKVIYNLLEFLGGRSNYVKLDVDAKTKTALLSLAVKFFFVPLMINFLVGNYAGVVSNVKYWEQSSADFDSVINLIISALFTLDTLIFTFGYLIEADFLHNRIRSVEPTMLGWVVALATYPPFNSITSQVAMMNAGGMNVFGENVHVYHAIKIAIVLCHLIFVACSVSLGFKGSNLTNRGIVKHGPYGIVRHPAYVAKLSAWFLEGVIFAPNMSYFVGWMMFGCIYFMRAWTEERHLSMDPDYVEYKQQVRYRFIPRVI